MIGDPDHPYVEVLCSIAVDDSDQRTYVVRALTIDTLAQLAADLVAADEHGRSIEDVFAGWSVVYD